MKKVLAILLVLVMVFALGACVNVTTTNTTTTTNPDGTTTTTTTTSNNGVTTTTTTTSKTMGEVCEDGQPHDFTFVIENSTDQDFAEFYLTAAGATEYENVLNDGEIVPANDKIDLSITTDKDTLAFDFGLNPAGTDDVVWFTDVDLSDFDADNNTLEFAYNDTGWHLYW